jgi:hypothetical protein
VSLQQCATSPQKEKKEENEKKEEKTGPETAQAGQEKEKKEENDKKHTSTDGLVLVAGGGIREALGEQMR